MNSVSCRLSFNQSIRRPSEDTDIWCVIDSCCCFQTV